MAFTASVLIQGLGNLVPHRDPAQGLCALFPDLDVNRGYPVVDAYGKRICSHFAVVQVKPEHLPRRGVVRRRFHLAGSDPVEVLEKEIPSDSKVGVTLDVSGHWVGFEAPGADPFELKDEATDANGDTVGLWKASELFTGDLAPHARVRSDVLPGGAAAAAELRGGVVVAAGRAAPATELCSAQWRLDDGKGTTIGIQDLRANALKVELGTTVESLTLLLAPLGGGPVRRIPLTCADQGTLDLWIRHFCEIWDPPTASAPGVNDRDADFLANYVLHEGSPMRQRGKALPHPRVEGKKIAATGCLCGNCLEMPTWFTSPFV